MHILLILLTAASMAMASGDLVQTKFFCVHCPHPMSLEISENILRQALAGLVPDDGPTYILVRTISGESIASHFYGEIYDIEATFKDAEAGIEKNCRVEIAPGKQVAVLQSVGSGPQPDYGYGEVKIKCGSEPEVIKKLNGIIMYPRDLQ